MRRNRRRRRRAVESFDAGFGDISIGPAIDVFGGSGSERNARTFDVYTRLFLATKPE